MPAMIALLRLLSQIWPCVSGKIAMKSKRSTKKDTLQNGSIDPKVSIREISYLIFPHLSQYLQYSLIPSLGANPSGWKWLFKLS